MRQADFSNSVFDQKAFFEDRTTFEGSAKFNNTLFSQVEFSNMILKGDIILDNALIKKHLDFVNPTFEFECNKLPVKTYLQREMSFESIQIEGSTSFRNITFPIRINFKNAKFEEYSTVNFDEIIFLSDVEFFNIHSATGSVLSFRASFKKKTDFRYSSLSGEVRIEQSNFDEYTDWSYSKLEEVIFREVTFSEVNFQGTNFAKAIFENVKFNKITNFRHAFFKAAIFSGNEMFNADTDFKFITFEEGNKVHFEQDDLHHVSFMNTDISRIHFKENVSWGQNGNAFKVLDESSLENSIEYTESLRYIFGEGGVDIRKYEKVDVSYNNIIYHIVIDRVENRLKVQVNNDTKLFVFSIEKFSNRPRIYSTLSIGGIKAMYRSLRENYEYWFRYEEADEVYLREMEIQRKYHEVTSNHETRSEKCGFIRRNFSLTGLYRMVATYGLDYKKPVIISAFIIAIPILYSIYELSLESKLTNKDIFETLVERLSSILGIKPEELTGYLIRLIAFSVLGVLILSAIKNRFGRKSRN
jgi:uncharacterized protein YjbI with pentapeptide repeats